MPPAQSSTSKACKQDGQHRNDETPLPATLVAYSLVLVLRGAAAMTNEMEQHR
jgi:hypothetical protein